MAWLGDYIHNNSLKFGIYSSAGNLSCGQRPGGLGYEDVDAQTWAGWGVDYLKYDNCYNYNISAKIRYSRMRDALNRTGRPIFYAICNWGEENIWEYGMETGNAWRTTYDIENSWGSFKFIFWQSKNLNKYVGPGGWNDGDMLEVGNGNMTLTEQRTHFAIYAIFKFSLILGNDLRNMKPEILAIISSKGLTQTHQDSLGAPAACVMNCDGDQAIATYMSKNQDHGGYYALVVTNWNDFFPQSQLLDFYLLGIAEAPYFICKVTDMWTDQVDGYFQGTYVVREVEPHDSLALKVECKSFWEKGKNKKNKEEVEDLFLEE